MKRILCSLVLLILVSAPVFAQDAGAPPAAAPPPAEHKFVMAAGLKYGDPPPIFRKGMTFTVISGDPGQPGPFVVRLKMPAGYKIMPHWHPTDENVTVLAGTFSLGMGDKFEAATMTKLPAGGFALLPAEMRHYAMAVTAVTVQVHGTGPFALNYVNPEDDPRNAPPPAK